MSDELDYSREDLILHILEKEGEDMNHYADTSTSEALETYMRTLNKLPLLTKEEETALTTSIDEKIAALINILLEDEEGFKALSKLGRFRTSRLKTIFSKIIEEDYASKEEDLDLAISNFMTTLNPKTQNKAEAKRIATKLKFPHKDLYKMLTLVDVSKAKEINALKVGLERAKNKLIECNLKLVFARAKKFKDRGLSLEDLIQEGNIGLMRATESYDISRGWKFSTYATYWLDQAFGRALANKGNLIRLPAYMVEKVNRINKSRRQLVQQLGRNPTDLEIATHASESIESVNQVNEMFILKVAELDAPISVEGHTLGDLLADPQNTTPLDVIADKEFNEEVRKAIATLEPKEQKIIRMRFGIGEKSASTFQTIGNTIGVSRQRVEQIEKDILKHLLKRKSHLLKKHWEA